MGGEEGEGMVGTGGVQMGRDGRGKAGQRWDGWGGEAREGVGMEGRGGEETGRDGRGGLGRGGNGEERQEGKCSDRQTYRW